MLRDVRDESKQAVSVRATSQGAMHRTHPFLQDRAATKLCLQQHSATGKQCIEASVPSQAGHSGFALTRLSIVAMLNISLEDTLAQFTMAAGCKKMLAFQPCGIKQSRGSSGTTRFGGHARIRHRRGVCGWLHVGFPPARHQAEQRLVRRGRLATAARLTDRGDAQTPRPSIV